MKKTGGGGFSRIKIGVLADIIETIETYSRYQDRIHVGALTDADELRILLDFNSDLLPFFNVGYVRRSNARGGQSGKLKYLQVTDAGFAAVRAYWAKAA